VDVMQVLFLPSADKMRSDAAMWAAVLGGSAGAMTVLFLLSGYFNGVAGAALTAKLRARGMGALVRQDMSFFDEDSNSAMELTAFLSEKVDKVKTITTEQLDLVAQLIGGVGSCVVIIFVWCSWQIALAFMAMLPVFGVLVALQAAFMTGGMEEANKAKGKDTSKKGVAEASANRIVGECVTGIRTVASFNLEQRFYDGFMTSSAKVQAMSRQDALVGGFFNGLSAGVFIALTGALFWYAVWLSNAGALGDDPMRKALAPMFVLIGAMVPMLKASALADLKNATIAAVRLFKLFDRVPTIDSFTKEGAKPQSMTGAIELRDVVFAYPSAADTPVCRGYSLSIGAGQTVALCGPSGSGKSTIIQLLERFYDPQSGVVLLDGVDIKTLNVRWLRAQMGLVGQEPVLFQGSVAMNIGYGKPAEKGAATQEEIEAAAKMANAHEFVTKDLSSGYNSDVGLKGGRLSGGQKQRIAIARALIRQPAVLLLDEATSALDNESERIVQAALDEIMTKQKRTTVVIAHRLSTIRGADKIAVVSDGKICEEGTHDELLAHQSLYANLVMAS